MSKLNLGAGNDIKEGYINHDRLKHRKEIEVMFDLNNPFFAEECKKINLINLEEIRAWDVIEHLYNPINFMNNCWTLLEKNGILHIKACGWKNPNFYVDITHIKAYDIKSFDYFDPDTEIGKEYNYYTKQRWKILEKNWDRNNNVIIKLTPIK